MTKTLSVVTLVATLNQSSRYDVAIYTIVWMVNDCILCFKIMQYRSASHRCSYQSFQASQAFSFHIRHMLSIYIRSSQGFVLNKQNKRTATKKPMYQVLSRYFFRTLSFKFLLGFVQIKPDTNAVSCLFLNAK